MNARTLWLNVGWLIVLVVTFAVPLTLDGFGRLTYFTSLTMWAIPILYLWPVFQAITAKGTKRMLASVPDQRSRSRIVIVSSRPGPTPIAEIGALIIASNTAT